MRTLKFFDKNDVDQFDLFQKLYNWWSKYPENDVFYDHVSNPTISTELINDFNIAYLTISTKKTLDDVNKELIDQFENEEQMHNYFVDNSLSHFKSLFISKVSVMQRVGILKNET